MKKYESIYEKLRQDILQGFLKTSSNFPASEKVVTCLKPVKQR